ncbi:MAG: 1-acyl-sn-glycerol-3-phosphate acyltransferase, partial [Endomicrobium sp.]|nr:1-acyl-sn-glycerol-3-phosphate acyltransferase [Endomicrobium sp.]
GGFFAYPYFLLTGFKAKQLRAFIYFQGKAVQAAIWVASLGNKRTTVCKTFGAAEGKVLKPSILVANHPCTYDTFVFSSFGIKNHVGIVKGWPFKIPFYGQYIKKAGYINSDGKTVSEITELAKERLSQGLHISIFPEGTRKKETGRFRSLAFEIAIRCNAAAVPFAIKGLEEMLPPGKYWPKYARIEYVKLNSVAPADFNGPAGGLKMAKYVKSLIVNELKIKN